MRVSLHEAQAAEQGSQPLGGAGGRRGGIIFALCLPMHWYPSTRAQLGYILRVTQRALVAYKIKLTDRWLVLCHAAYIASMSCCSAILVCMYCNSRFDIDEVHVCHPAADTVCIWQYTAQVCL